MAPGAGQGVDPPQVEIVNSFVKEIVGWKHGRTDESLGSILSRFCGGIEKQMKITIPETYEEYQQQMIRAAKELQGDNYAGDDYYLQDCWREYWENGDSAYDSVVSDMGYWD